MTAAPLVSAPYLASAALLAVAGAAKAARPTDTARALRAAGLPASRRSVRGFAAAEVLLAVAAFTVPGPVPPALLGLSYFSFGTFIFLAMHQGWSLSSCGCFGKEDSPPTVAHAAVNFTAAAAAVWWAAAGGPSVASVFRGQPGAGVPLAIVCAVIAALALLVYTNPLPAVKRSNS